MTSFFENFRATVKAEPRVKDEPIEPADDDELPLDDNDLFVDPDADVDDKPAAAARASRESAPRTREPTVRNVMLTPVGRPSPLVDAARALPHEAGVMSLDAYDEPSHAELAASRAGADHAVGDSAQSAATFVNYIIARSRAGGLPVGPSEGGGGGFGSAFIRHWITAPPHRALPASQSAAVLRLSSEVVDWEQFIELCATPRPGEPPCCRGSACEALDVRNSYGQRINDTPFVAHWFAHEQSQDSADRAALKRKMAERMCILCEIFFAARAFAKSASTNTAVNASGDARLAVGWHVLVNTDGQFCQHQTLGPDSTCFNGFVGNVPRPVLVGWSLRPTTNTSRVEFLPPYQRYAAQEQPNNATGF